MDKMALKDKTIVAYMNEFDLPLLQTSLGSYIRNIFGLWEGNEELMASCATMIDKEDLHPDEAAMVIIEELWKKLQESHVLRVVK